MAFSGLLNAGFIRYVDGLGYYLPYVFTPLEIALVLPNAGKDLKSDENKNAGVERLVVFAFDLLCDVLMYSCVFGS